MAHLVPLQAAQRSLCQIVLSSGESQFPGLSSRGDGLGNRPASA